MKKKVTKKDLTEENLNKLIKQINKLVEKNNTKSYNTLTKLVEQLAQISKKSTLKINDTGDKTIKVGRKKVDYMNAIEEIKYTIDEGIAKNKIRSKDTVAKDRLIEEMEKTLNVLLKQDEIMDQMKINGITQQEFKDYMKDAINKSKNKYNKLEKQVNKAKELKERVFGKDDYDETSNTWNNKTRITEIEHEKETLKELGNIGKEMSKMVTSKEEIIRGGLTPEEEAEKKKKIAECVAQIKRKIKNITDKQIKLHTGSAIDFKGVKSISEHTSITDLNGKLINDLNDILVQISDDMYTNYEVLSQQIINANEADIKELGFADKKEAIDKIGKAGSNSKQQIELDDMILDYDDKIEKFEHGMKVENNFQKETEDSILEFENRENNKTEISKRITEAKDDDGNIIKDVLGKPVMVATQDGRNKYLQDNKITYENQYIQDGGQKERNRQKGLYNSLPTDRKKALITVDYQSDGKKHPIKWIQLHLLGQRDRMWKEFLDKELVNAENTGKRNAQIELDKIVAKGVKSDVQELADIEQRNQEINDIYNQEFNDAQIQQQVLNNMQNTQERNGAIDASDIDELMDKTKMTAVLEASLEDKEKQELIALKKQLMENRSNSRRSQKSLRQSKSRLRKKA